MAIYGAKLWKSPTNAENYEGGKIVGKNSEVFTSGDPVSLGASGLYVTVTNSAVYGIVAKTATMTSTNATVALVKPVVQPIDQDYDYVMGVNGTAGLASSTFVGNFYALAGSTGTIQVDVNSGVTTTTMRVVVCTGVDPYGTSATNVGLFKFVKVSNVKSDSA